MVYNVRPLGVGESEDASLSRAFSAAKHSRSMLAGEDVQDGSGPESLLDRLVGLRRSLGA